MAADSPADPFQEFQRTHARLLERLHAKAEGTRWGVSRVRFTQAVYRSAEHGFRGTRPKPGEVASYLESLYVEDLALACACRDGHEQAWEHFVGQYRQDLYAAARAIIGQRRSGGVADAEARELADSIYAELYGLERAPVEATHPDGIGGQPPHRRSLLDYFHGRSKLSTWLRAVLAQRHIDAFRASQRTESLDETEEAATEAALRRGVSHGGLDPDRTRYLALIQTALLEALAALSPRDRLRLGHYYVQELTLAQIGRILGEHEATTSRHLEKTRRELRQRFEHILRTEKNLSDAQIRLCYEYASEEWPFDLTHALGARTPPGRAADSPGNTGTQQGLPRAARGED